MKFTNITGWSSCVLRNSVLYTEAKAGNLVLHDHYILAHSAYPLRNWLITSFEKFGTSYSSANWLQQETIKCKTSCRTERLKGRFRRLQDIPLHNSKEMCQMILATCILYNLCIINDDEVADNIENT